MASRKEQKEQARARRVAEEQAASARAHRMRRLQLLAGAVIVAVVVIAVAIAISVGGSSSSSGLQNRHQASQTYAQVSSLLAGIPQSGVTLGNPSAKVTLVYYGDLECPICRDFTLDGGFPQLVQNDVRQGRVKVIYKSFCTATCNGPGQSVFNTQQVAAYAAGKQDLFWDYAELFYREQGQEGTSYVNAKYLETLAGQIPKLNLAEWQKQRGDPSLLAQVQSDESHGSAIGVTGTPTLIAEGPKGSQPVGSAVPSYSDLETAIKQVA
jgi:protein-disulfide isomerase